MDSDNSQNFDADLIPIPPSKRGQLEQALASAQDALPHSDYINIFMDVLHPEDKAVIRDWELEQHPMGEERRGRISSREYRQIITKNASPGILPQAFLKLESRAARKEARRGPELLAHEYFYMCEEKHPGGPFRRFPRLRSPHPLWRIVDTVIDLDLLPLQPRQQEMATYHILPYSYPFFQHNAYSSGIRSAPPTRTFITKTAEGAITRGHFVTNQVSQEILISWEAMVHCLSLIPLYVLHGRLYDVRQIARTLKGLVEAMNKAARFEEAVKAEMAHSGADAFVAKWRGLNEYGQTLEDFCSE